MRLAMVSEHASPLAVLGGVDAGGQNVHVASLALALGARGHAVTVHTRRDDPLLPPVVALAPRVSVHHVDAGPPEAVPKDDLFPHMDRFAEVLCDEWRRCRPDIVHSHFWMSGYAASVAARALDLPHVHTFHALGVVKRRHQPEKDTSPPERISEEARLLHRCDRIIATCADEVFELRRLGASAEAATIVPCGVDPRHFTPEGPIEQRTPHRARIVSVGRLVERKGVGNVIDALVGLP